MNTDRKIAFIGTGFMASAMIDGIISGGVSSPDSIYAVNDAFPDIAAQCAERFGINTGCAADLAKCDTVVFGVKPQVFPEALEMYGEYLTPDKLYLSIMAGISTEKLESSLGGAGVVRLMPNMPLSVGKSATVYCLGSAADENDARFTEELFSPLGLIKKVDEDMISAVTALSGSGPAYFCRLTEAMTDAGVSMGLDRSLAEALAVQTLIGTAETIAKTGVSAAELRARITSKKGTTEAALNKMTEMNFDHTVSEAMTAAKKRSDELGK